MAVGEDIAFPTAPAFSRCQTACGHIPHIHKIVSAIDAGRQLAVDIIRNHLHQMVAGTVVRAEDTGRMHHHCVQPVIRCIEHDLGGLRLGLGITAHHFIRGKMAHLMQHAVLVLLRDRMH